MMELFRNLRIKAGKSMLSVKAAKNTRETHFMNFSRVKSIGVVWDASKPEYFIILSRFHQKMSEQNKKVTILTNILSEIV